jgi:hypothetical protein
MKNTRKIFKGIFFFSFAFLFFANMTLLFSSCSSSDDDNSSTNNDISGTNTQKLCRTWYIKSVKLAITKTSTGANVVTFTDSTFSNVVKQQYAWEKINDSDFSETDWQQTLANNKYVKQVYFAENGVATFYYVGSGYFTDSWTWINEDKGTLHSYYFGGGDGGTESTVSFSGNVMTWTWSDLNSTTSEDCVYYGTTETFTLTFEAHGLNILSAS